MRIIGASLTVPVSVVAGASADASLMADKAVSLVGTFVGTYQVQINLDPALGSTNWVNEGAALTAAGALEITKPCFGVRLNCTAYTSGTPVGFLAGQTW